MRLVKLASVSLNTTVGATRSNTQAAIEAACTAERENATVVAFPEQTIGGYAEEDLVQWRDFVAAQWSELRRFAEETKSLAIVSVVGLTVRRRDHLYNCAAVVHAGRVLGLVPKEKLPSYNVFYEGRTFARGQVALYDEVDGIPFGDLVFDFGFGTMAVEVCEDLWSPDGPMRRRCYGGAELVVNLSASPFRIGIAETRREMIATRSGDNQCVVLYTNLVGANDGLIFDGGAYVAQNGRMLLDGDRFRADTFYATVDLDRTRRLRTENTTWRMDQESFAMPAQAASYFEGAHAVSSGALSGVRHVRCEAQTASLKHPYPVPVHGSFFLPRETDAPIARARFCEELLNALSLGVWDYFHKTRAFKTIGVALSGGRDSLLCLWIARRAVLLGNGLLASKDVTKTNAVVSATLRAFFMPSQYSSGETRAAAEKTAQELGIPFVVSPIDEAFEKELLATQALLQPGEVVTPLTRQNIQARIRAERMWNWSNSAAGLFLQTSNMSEKSVGYTTIGGDME
nr:NAD(+) synthase [Polyangiaceae bacterium]